jgi:lactoylglutathione lyase
MGAMTETTSAIAHIATTAVYVEDTDRALDFWTRRVGFEKRRDDPMDGSTRWVEVAPPGSATCLVLFPRASMPDWAERKPSVVLRCDDVDAAYRALTSNGVRFEGPPQDLPFGRFATFLDTEGNQFGLRA